MDTLHYDVTILLSIASSDVRSILIDIIMETLPSKGVGIHKVCWYSSVYGRLLNKDFMLIQQFLSTLSFLLALPLAYHIYVAVTGRKRTVSGLNRLVIFLLKSLQICYVPL